MIMPEAVCESPLACNLFLISGKHKGPTFCVQGVPLEGGWVVTIGWDCAVEELDG